MIKLLIRLLLKKNVINFILNTKSQELIVLTSAVAVNDLEQLAAKW
jgi:hypothetical protein